EPAGMRQRSVMSVTDIHSSGLAVSTALSRYYMNNAPTPAEVISVLNAAGIQFMLIGAHGLVGWIGAPRATQDVDVVVALRHQKKAVRALLAAFPHLQADELEVVTRLRDPQTKQAVIDVIKPTEPLYRSALKHTESVSSQGQTYKVPTLEMAIAL